MKLLVITPACNEEGNLPDLIQSMSKQSLLPDEWIIVDDGSIDNTSNVILNASNTYSWLKYLRKPKNNLRSPGKSVMETFYFGLENNTCQDYDLVMKLDADLILPTNYIDKIVHEFKTTPNLGICGGVCVIDVNGNYVLEKQTNSDHIRGALKTYNKHCFVDIGGLLKKMGWDTVDEHHARYRGWKILVKSDLKVIHKRETNKEYGVIKAATRNGQMLYSIRMDIFLLLGNCFKLFFKPPYFLLSCAMFGGYIVAFFNRNEKIVSKDLGRFIRKYRYKKIWERIV